MAALLMHEGGYGIVSYIVVGIIGALLGGLLQPRGFLSDHLDIDRALPTASIVACALIALKIALVYALGSMRPRPTEQTPGVSRSPAPTAQSWWHRHPYLASFMLGLVPAALMVALVAAGLFADVHERQYLIAYILLEMGSAPVAIPYPLVVLAALASLIMPRLRRRYAGGSGRPCCSSLSSCWSWCGLAWAANDGVLWGVCSGCVIDPYHLLASWVERTADRMDILGQACYPVAG